MKTVQKKLAPIADTFYLLSLMLLYYFWNRDPEIMFFVTCVYALCFLAFVLKFRIVKQLLLGLLIAVIYLTFYKEFYNYNTFSLRLFGYPLFPLFAWPFALTLLSYYISMLMEVMSIEKVWIKISVAYAVYVVMLIFLEYTGYHYLNIRLTSHYTSLPLIDCLHTPASLKLVYFINGLIFFTAFFHLADDRRQRKFLFKHPG